MKHNDAVYLQHILDAIARIEMYLQNVNEVSFNKNYMMQDAVIRQMEIIGEATKQISKKLRQQFSQIPWQDMAGMRDKLIHDYLGVDIETVWLTTQDDIPILKQEIVKILKKF